MEQRAAELQARLATVATFGELVDAMRGVAAARIQRARALLEGANAYADAVTRAMAQALALMPAQPTAAREPPAASLWLVFCAEQGFNGGFSETVLAAAAEAGATRVLLIGSRGLRAARQRGLEPEAFVPLIAHAQAVVSAAERLRGALAQALGKRAASTVELVHAEMTLGQRYAVHRHRLLPPERPTLIAVGRSAPLVHLPPARLFDELVIEYVAARLAQALLHSHAAENAARLQAMVAAHDHVARMADDFRADERRLRQEAITAEIVELSAGLRAMRER